MTSQSPWHVDGHLAELRATDLRAAVDLRNPAAGVRVGQFAGDAARQAALLQIPIAGGAARGPDSIEFFVRGGDLVATYGELPATPVRAEIYWRFIAAQAARAQSAGEAGQTASELILSVQTSLLDSDPSLAVGSTLPAMEIWRLGDAESGRFAECRPVGQREMVFAPKSGPACFLFRSAAPLSYVEMVHPADFRHSTLHAIDSAAGIWQLQHRLFEQRLEKGVILRSRLRGMFVARDADMAIAASEYRRFGSSEPPLTA